VALRDADGVHKVEATPLTEIGTRLRGATVGVTTFGDIAGGTRRHRVKGEPEVYQQKVTHLRVSSGQEAKVMHPED